MSLTKKKTSYCYSSNLIAGASESLKSKRSLDQSHQNCQGHQCPPRRWGDDQAKVAWATPTFGHLYAKSIVSHPNLKFIVFHGHTVFIGNLSSIKW